VYKHSNQLLFALQISSRANITSWFAYLHIHTQFSTSKHCCRHGSSECKHKPTGCESHSLLCKWRFHYPCIPLYVHVLYTLILYRVSPYMQGKICYKSSPSLVYFYPGRCRFTIISCYTHGMYKTTVIESLLISIYIFMKQQKVYGNEVDNVVPMLCIV